MKTSSISFASRLVSFHFSRTTHPNEVNDFQFKKSSMKMKKTTLSVVILGISLVFSTLVMAQQRKTDLDSMIVAARSLVDSGYAAWNKAEMLHGYAFLQRAAVLVPGNKYVRYFLSYAGYRLMTYGMAMKEDNIYREFADPADKMAGQLSNEYPNWSEPRVLLAAIYGIEIAHNWMNGPTLGPKSSALADKAIALDSTNPRAYLILGASKLNTPSIFGGNVDKAVEYFRKSISIFESEPKKPASDLEPSWGYIDALTWLGLAYEKQDRYTAALAEYRKALAADPGYERAKNVLIPEVEKKIDSTSKK